MSATYTPGSSADRDRVRLLIPDKTLTGLTPSGGVYTLTTYSFLDAELDDLLTTESHPKRAAALALEILAADPSRAVAVSGQGYSIDRTKTARALMERAAALREQAATDEDLADAPFDVAEQAPNDFAARERIYKQRLRGVI